MSDIRRRDPVPAVRGGAGLVAAAAGGDDPLGAVLEQLVRDAPLFGEGAAAYEAGVLDTLRAVRGTLVLPEVAEPEPA